ncbi:MAG: UDP-N-acetylmuramoyl-L-alanyl-D-glutamate--2,6-diaminopimelate ligase [Alphaproteobacteria bacterium]|nr:UDP-N-acetylmuramoyl-L-alanyl-D-glutamate--2,6-diaminopimelate ligase [Alphaproteobacteria bacterium]
MAVVNDQDIVGRITGLSADSRAVKPGYLFAALPGSAVDGRDYIPDAVRNGAAVILASEGTVLPESARAAGVMLVTDARPRRAFALMAAQFYGYQPKTIAAVTGTNGKSSTVHFVRQLWEALGYRAASLGTLGIEGTGVKRTGSMTTPDPVTLHAELAALVAEGITHLAMEASSHGLDQYRLDGVRVKAAGFTNLSRDHLDYHKDMDAYRAAKARLFTEILEPDGIAVLNADVPEYETLEHICKERQIRIIAYGRAAGVSGLRLVSLEPLVHGQEIEIEFEGMAKKFVLPLIGEFQAMNTLCALGLVVAERPDDAVHMERVLKALETLKPVPGRLQPVSGHPSGAAVYIDYAHTPDALSHALGALRPHTDGRLVCLFGCGGDRDHGKRPLMGEVAVKLADQVIVTDDNPRSEDPASIRREILSGAPGALEVEGRAKAIQVALEGLEAGDVLLIAGKGHERGQIFADRTEPFDDVEEAEKAIGRLKRS